MSSSIRPFIKNLFAWFMFYSGLLFLSKIIWHKAGKSKATIFYYHRVSDKKDTNSQLVSRFEVGVPVALFEKQMKCLSRGYNAIPMEQLATILRNGKKLPSNTIVITFDDGYQDNFSNAYPVLKKYKLPAIIFAASDFIATTKIIWWDKLIEIMKVINGREGDINEILDDSFPIELKNSFTKFNQLSTEQKQDEIEKITRFLKQLDPQQRDLILDNLAKQLQWCEKKSFADHSLLSWEQAIEMSRNNITFGGHTKTHPLLTRVDDKVAQYEVQYSKQVLEQQIGKPVSIFAYPSGDFDERIKKLVEQAGFSAACSTKQGKVDSRSDIYALNRLGICEWTFKGLFGNFSRSLFHIKMSGMFDFLFFR